MTDALSIGLLHLLRKAQVEGDVDFLRNGVCVFGQAMLEREVTQPIGAACPARIPVSVGQRNSSATKLSYAARCCHTFAAYCLRC